MAIKLRVQPIFLVGPSFSESLVPSRKEILNSARCELTRRIEDVFPAVHDRLGNDVVLSEPLVVTSRKEILEASAQVKDIDVLLAFPLLGESQAIMAQVGLFKKPVVFYNQRNLPSHFVCSAYGRLRSNGFVEAEIALTPEDVAQFLHFRLVLKKIKGTRLVVFGRPGLSVPDSVADPTALSRFGIWAKMIPMRDLLKEYNKVEPGQYKDLARQWMRKASAVKNVTEEQIQEVARLQLAIQKFIDELSANAVAVDCMALLKSANVSPCVNVEQLDDKRIPTSCEADLNSLFAKLILSYLSGKPSFMGNLVTLNPEENILVIAHNTMPLRMAGFDRELQPYALWPYGGTGVQIVSEMVINEAVTLLRVARNLRDAVVAKGKIVSVNALPHAEYVQASIELRDIRQFLSKLLGNHHALVYGDYVREVKYLATELNLRVEEV